jgi:phage-related minor tail protein
MTNALRSQLELNNTDFVTKMVQAGQVTEREAAKIVRAYKYAGDQARALAKTQQSANDAVGGFADSAHAAGRASSGMTRELIVLGHELATGRYTRFGGSLLVLAEYSQTATKALSLLVGPVGMVIGAVAALGILLHAGASEQDKFNTSLVRTGNFAGVTAASFDDMANRVSAATHSTIGTSKEALQELVNTGQIGQRSLESAGRATVAMERLTGESADKIAGDFAKMSEGVAKWAGEHNRSMHFITVAQYEEIAAMEKAGNTAGAMQKVFDAVNAKNAELTQSTGNLAKAWDWVAHKVSDAKQALADWGKDKTTSQLLDQALKDLDRYQKTLTGYVQNDSSAKDIHAVETKIMKEQVLISNLKEKLRLEEKSANLQSSQGMKDQKAIDALMNPHKSAEIKLPHGMAGRISQEEIKKLMEDALPQASQRDLLRMIEHGQGTNAGLFDKMYPKANSSEILKSQKDNASAHRLFIEQEIKDAETLSKTFTKYKPAQDTGYTEAINKYLKSIGDGTKFAETMVNGSMKRMEDAIMNFAATGKLSFRDLWTFMAQEYLRNLIKMGEQKLLGSATGSGGGVNWGSVISTVAGFFGFGGVNGSHANGLASVPYDGYIAELHKGEKVQTAVEAAADRNGSRSPTINMSTSIGSVGAGVNRAEMAGAMAQNNRAQKAQLQRLRLQGLLT